MQSEEPIQQGISQLPGGKAGLGETAPIDHSHGISLAPTDINNRKLVEDLLMEERNLLRTLIDHLPDYIYVKDLESRFVLTNRANLELLSVGAIEETIGKSVRDFFPPELAELYLEDDQAVMQSGKLLIDREEPIISRMGEARWLSTTKVPLRDRDGRIIGLVGISRDITERKRAELALRESETNMVAAQRIAHFGSWELDLGNLDDLDANRLRWSDEMFRIFGCEPGSTVSRAKFFRAVHPDDHELIKHAVAKAIRERGPYSVIHRIVLPTGEERVLHEIAQVFVDERTGNPLKMIGTAHDITELRQTEERLREQAALLDKAQDAIMAKDLDDHILFWSKGAERVFGWTSLEAVGRRAPDLLCPDPARYFDAKKLLYEKGDWTGELPLVARSGRELIVENRWTLVRDSSGRPKSILAIATDITGRKKLETQFLRAQRMESIGTLAGGIAHDLNNVLAPILMSVELLDAKVIDLESHRLLASVRRSAQRGADMVRQVLSFARGMDGQRMVVLPRHLVNEVAAIVKDTFPKAIQIETRVPEMDWTIRGDPTQLHQVLLNLCLNARDAMPHGGRLGIMIENQVLDQHYVGMNSEARLGPHVVIQVSDSGTGIPVEIRDRIFEPFFTTKMIGKGTGLGLSTVLGIVKSHGGFVNLYSELNKGTTFRVHLPADKTGGLPLVEEKTQSLPRGNGELILVVDDEEPILDVTRKILERYNYKTMTAKDGAGAVALYAQHLQEIAVVLTDMVMPIMDGIATIIALRRINPEARIIAASGLGSNASIARVVDAGVKHFLPKPYTADALLKTIREIILQTPRAT